MSNKKKDRPGWDWDDQVRMAKVALYKHEPLVFAAFTIAYDWWEKACPDCVEESGDVFYGFKGETAVNTLGYGIRKGLMIQEYATNLIRCHLAETRNISNATSDL